MQHHLRYFDYQRRHSLLKNLIDEKSKKKTFILTKLSVAIIQLQLHEGLRTVDLVLTAWNFTNIKNNNCKHKINEKRKRTAKNPKLRNSDSFVIFENRSFDVFVVISNWNIFIAFIHCRITILSLPQKK